MSVMSAICFVCRASNFLCVEFSRKVARGEMAEWRSKAWFKTECARVGGYGNVTENVRHRGFVGIAVEWFGEPCVSLEHACECMCLSFSMLSW